MRTILSFDWAFWFQWIMATTVGWVLGRLLLPNLATVTIGVALGFFQWFILQNRIRNSWWWIPATISGWTLGSVIILAVAPEGLDVIAGMITGATTGVAQWLVLRREVNWAGWWIAMNIVAWTTGLALLPGLILTGVMAGVITGFTLILLLEYPKAEGDHQV